MNEEVKFSEFLNFSSGDLAARASTVLFAGLGDNAFGVQKNIKFLLSDFVSYVSTSLNSFVNGGNSFGVNAKIGTNDAFQLYFRTNNTDRGIIHANGRFGFGTTTDAGFFVDINGTLRVNGVQTFQTSNIRINHSGSLLGNVIIGDSVNSLGGTANRAVIIGNSNNLSGITSQPYINVFGYSNTCNVNITPVYVNGNFNIINGVGYNDIRIIGDSNTRTAGGHSTIIGSNCVVNHTGNVEGLGCVIIGNVSSVLHDRCSIIGNNVVTTANNQLIVAQNGTATTDGYNDVYFGTGPVRSTTQAAFMNNVTINGSGAANGVTDANGASIIIAGGKGLSSGTGGDVIFATTTALVSGTTRQSLTNRWWVKFNTGFLGNSSSPTSWMDITGANGYTQLRLRTSYTPTSSADTNGNIGDISWDANYIYWKTAGGWMRATGASW